jgi:hypothetical protein
MQRSKSEMLQSRLETEPEHFTSNYIDDYEPVDSEDLLRLKWLDNSPRMSRLRDHRQKRLINKLEVIALNFCGNM